MIIFRFYFVLSITLSFFLFFSYYYQIIPDFLLGVVSQDALLVDFNSIFNDGGSARSLGYRYMQSVFSNLVTEDRQIFIFFQVWLFFISGLFLFKQFYFLTGRKIFSILMFLTVVLNPKIFKYTLMIEEEGVYISLVMFLCALMIQFCRTISWKILALLSLTIGVMISIRPTGYALLPLLPIFFIFYYKHLSINPIHSFMIVLIPVMSVISFESYLYHSNSDYQRESTLGVNLLGSIPLIAENKPENSRFPILVDNLYEKGKNVRKLISQADSFSIAQYLRNEIHPMYHDSGELPGDIRNQITMYKSEFGTRDSITTGVYIEFAKENPVETLKHIALTFIGHWQISEILNSEDWKKLSQDLNTHTLKNTQEVIYVQKHMKVIKHYTSIISWVKLLFVLILLLCIYLFIVGLTDWNREKDKLSYSATTGFLSLILPLLIFGYILLLSIVINVQVRLVFTYWPLMVLILFLFLLRVLDLKKDKT